MSELSIDQTVLKGTGGAYFKSKGVVTANTTLGSIEYRLEYKVLSQEAIPAQLLLGDLLLDQARVLLEKDGAVIRPLVGE